MRHAWKISVGAALTGLLAWTGLASLEFRARMQATGGPLPTTAVVFTGQFDRIEAGLALRAQGRIERLFISGVNPPAGLRPERFAAQFGLSAALRNDLATGRIVLATRAQSTLGNALETACWLHAMPGTDHLLLITSRAHMPRASLALERALPGVAVARLPVAGDVPETALPWAELRKFGLTWWVTWLPPLAWPAKPLDTCP